MRRFSFQKYFQNINLFGKCSFIFPILRYIFEKIICCAIIRSIPGLIFCCGNLIKRQRKKAYEPVNTERWTASRERGCMGSISSQAGIIIAIIAYLVGMLLIGFITSKRNSSVGDFYLGGRQLGPLVTAMSAEASDMSSWLLMGLPGLAYLSGVAEPFWTAIGLAAGTYLNWLFVARRFRNYTVEAGDAITVPEYFSNRYGDKKKILTLISALIIVIFFIPYTASGFAAIGKLFASLFSLDYHVSMIVGALIVIGYTMTGGFLAASLTDLVQSIIMTIALIVVLVFGINQSGGWAAVVSNAEQLSGHLSLFRSHIPDAGNFWAPGTSGPYSALTIVSTLAWGLGYFGMPHILLRFMAIRDEKKLKLSRRIASVWVVIAMGAAILIGIIGLGMSKTGTIEVLSDSSAAETVIVRIAHRLSEFGFGPALIAGVILSGIIASTMSTSDSQLLAASSSVSKDIVSGFLNRKMNAKGEMLIARLTLGIIAAIGIVLAWNPNNSVFRIVSFAWAGFGAAFGPAVLLSLYWRRSNRQGTLCGMAAGGAMVFVWKFLVRPLGGGFDIYELLPAFLISCLVNVAVSLLTPAPDQAITDTFDKVAHM